MTKRVAITGNTAAAEAMRQIEPDVIAAFPITPSTQIIEEYAKYAAEGAVSTEMITVESEHSAMSACLGASLAGARVMTATSANGLALMWEMLYIASGMRQPIVMALVNRALSAPINIHCDHGDSMGARDSGWIQIYAESNQEMYDSMIMAPRIAEHPDVRLPLMVCMDGFIISHAIETMVLEDDAKVNSFAGEHTTLNPLLDTDNPVSWGALDLHDYYIEHKRAQREGIDRSSEVIASVCREFAAAFGREYGLYDPYMLDDADNVIVAINSISGEIREAVDAMRLKGVKAGLLRVRVFRPFPYNEIREALKNAKVVLVLDRSESFGGYGPLFGEVRSALYDLQVRPLVYNRVFGLGGREISVDDIKGLYELNASTLARGGAEKIFDYINVRG
jgi:pyruvate ferredoxin oxidoreductase alpha subunit